MKTRDSVRWRVSVIAALAVAEAGPGCRSVPDIGEQQQGQNQSVDGAGGLESTRIGGDMTVDTLTIPAGTTVTVTSDLHIISRGSVTIDGDLIAEPSATNGYSVVIEAEGDIDVSGAIEAGDGAFAAAPRTARTNPDNFAGCDGGSVEMISHDGHVTVFMTARIRAGDGTEGRSGFKGAIGGRGGSVSLCAARDLTVRGSIHVGNGGNGGDADLTTAELGLVLIGQGDSSQLDLLGRGVTARFTNGGGDSGFLYATASSFDFPFLNQTPQRTLYLDLEKYTSVDGGLTRGIIDGGVGGSAGLVFVIDPPELIDNQLKMLRESPPTGEGEFALIPISARAADGGRGWYFGGIGGSITMAGAQWDGKDGKAIEAIGGDGGSVFSRADPTSPCGNAVVVLNARAGFGGLASATAAAGLGPSWPGGSGEGGAGGSASAFGGNGGEAEQEIRQIAGNGGMALAIGGGAGSGRSSCFAPDQSGQGGYGHGGRGGGAEAIGGNGGDGFVPGTPGTAQAIAGDGGNGGNGAAAAGLGGKGGLSNATVGFIGRTVLPGDPIPEHNNSDRPNIPGSGFNGLPGQSEELAPPEFCSQTDYECPGGQLCGALQ